MKNRAQQYLENHILTAPKEDLLLMLFDGAIRFAEQARPKIEAKDHEGSGRLLIRAQRIVIELMTSLSRDLMGEEIYGNLMSLYNFIYFRLVNANMKKDVALVDEAVKILAHLRETWSQAVEKNRREQFPQLALLEKVQQEHAASQAKTRPSATINIQG